jgi:hypothetical protein
MGRSAHGGDAQPIGGALDLSYFFEIGYRGKTLKAKKTLTCIYEFDICTAL